MIGLLIFVAYWIFTIRKKNDISLLFLFLQVTACFQIVPLSFITLQPAITKSYDWVLIIMIIHLIVNFLKIIGFKGCFTLPLRIFVFYLVFLLVFSIAILNIDYKVVFAVFRTYIFLIAPILFIDYTYLQIQNGLKFIALFTVIAAFIYIIQGVVGVSLLSSLMTEDTNSSVGAAGLTRFYNLPFYALFSLFYYSNQLFKKINIIAIVPVIILLGAVVISFNRNTEFAALFGLVFIYFHKRKITLVNILIIGIVAGAFLFIAVSNQAERGRYESSDFKAMTDINGFKNPSTVDIRKISTTRFRILHFYERYLYVYNNSSLTYLTGIGLVSDQYAPIMQKLNFNVGTATGHKSDKGQIDTGDIVWSLFLLQTGMIGIFLFLAIVVSYVRVFFKYAGNDIAYISSLYLITMFFVAFFGTEIMFPPVIFLYSMLYIYTVKLSTINGLYK